MLPPPKLCLQPFIPDDRVNQAPSADAKGAFAMGVGRKVEDSTAIKTSDVREHGSVPAAGLGLRRLCPCIAGSTVHLQWALLAFLERSGLPARLTGARGGGWVWCQPREV